MWQTYGALYNATDDALYDAPDDADDDLKRFTRYSPDDALYDVPNDTLYGATDDALYEPLNGALNDTHTIPSIYKSTPCDALYDTPDDKPRSDDALYEMAWRRQAIPWTNADILLWHTYVYWHLSVLLVYRL